MTYTNKRGIIARKGFLNGKKAFSRQETDAAIFRTKETVQIYRMAFSNTRSTFP